MTAPAMMLSIRGRTQRLRLAADASAILLAGLKVLAWYFLSPDMFRSEATDTRTGSGSASKIEGPNALRWRSIIIGFTPLSVWSLSKIAHIYRLIVTGVVGKLVTIEVSSQASINGARRGRDASKLFSQYLGRF